MTSLVLLPALASAESLRVVALGDSLTAGYGLDSADLAFPAQLEAALRARGHDVVIVNAGVSGDTATGGLARLDWSVPDDVDAVIVALGANDMLRGVDPSETEKALDAILLRLKQRKLEVSLLGMRAAPNLGEDFVTRFDGLYPRLAERHDAVFYPFFLEGVAANAALNQADGIHPTAEGVAVIVTRILPTIETLLARLDPAG